MLATAAHAGSAVTWLEGGSPSPPSHARHHRHRARRRETDHLRDRMIPSSSHSRGQKDMRDLEDERDAVDLAAVTGDYVAASSSDVPQQRTESAGGGVDFRAAPPAADTEDIARRVRASDGEVVLLHGGLVEGGDSADATAVLAGVGSPEGLFFCELADKTDAGTEALASPGVAVSPDGRTAYFHGGYRVWDGGDDFADADDLSIFDGDASRWTCADDDCGAGELGGGTRVRSRHSVTPVTPGRRDEHVAVITPDPIELGHAKQRAMVVFGGRDETDARLDSVYALGLDDAIWREIRASPPAAEKGRVADQGPFDLPAVVQRSHRHGEPYPLARSGAAAVVSPDNVMFVHGGFVVEGRLGFNVGELLALDLNTFEFFYPKTSGDPPVRRNKHTAVIDDHKRMWVWGGSVWDHTGGSATYASTATHVADVSDPSRVTWTRVETKGLPPSQRRMHGAVHRDGVMYIIGGEDYHSKQFLQDVHALDLETLTWSQPAVAGNARGGRIRAAAARVRVGDPARALAGCGEGESAPATTGELQPKSDKLVTALEETSAAMGRPFAAAMGKRSEDGDADAVRAGWVPRPARGASDARPGVGLLVESRAMWELHLLARVAGEGLMEVGEEDVSEFSRRGGGDDRAGGRDAAVVGDDGWAVAPRRDGARDAFKIETKLADEMAAVADDEDLDVDADWDEDVASRWAKVLDDDDRDRRSTDARRGPSPSRARRPDAYADAVADDAYADAVADQGLRSKTRAEAAYEALDEFDAASALVESEAEAEKAAEKAAKTAEEAERAAEEAEKAAIAAEMAAKTAAEVAKTAEEASRRDAEDDLRGERASEGERPKLRAESERRVGGGETDGDALDASNIANLADVSHVEAARKDARRTRREPREPRSRRAPPRESEPEEEMDEISRSSEEIDEVSRSSGHRLREAALGESMPSGLGEIRLASLGDSARIDPASLGDSARIDPAPRETEVFSTGRSSSTARASSPLENADEYYDYAPGPMASPAEALDALFADEPAPSKILDLPGADDYDDDAKSANAKSAGTTAESTAESTGDSTPESKRPTTERSSASLGVRTSSVHMSVEQRASEKASELTATRSWATSSRERRRLSKQASPSARASAWGAAVVMVAVAAFGMRRATRTVVRGVAAERLPLVGGARGPAGLAGATPVAPRDEGAETEEGAWQKAAAARWQHHLGDPYDGIDEEAYHS